jgi:hypothetical protein
MLPRGAPSRAPSRSIVHYVRRRAMTAHLSAMAHGEATSRRLLHISGVSLGDDPRKRILRNKQQLRYVPPSCRNGAPRGFNIQRCCLFLKIRLCRLCRCGHDIAISLEHQTCSMGLLSALSSLPSPSSLLPSPSLLLLVSHASSPPGTSPIVTTTLHVDAPRVTQLCRNALACTDRAPSLWSGCERPRRAAQRARRWGGAVVAPCAVGCRRFAVRHLPHETRPQQVNAVSTRRLTSPRPEPRCPQIHVHTDLSRNGLHRTPVSGDTGSGADRFWCRAEPVSGLHRSRAAAGPAGPETGKDRFRSRPDNQHFATAVAPAGDDDVFYWFLQKQKRGASSIYTLRKVRTIRGCLEGLTLMI